MRRTLTLVAGTGMTLLLLGGSASAHVTANPDEADGEFFKTDFRVSHGCEDEATTALRIQIPDGVSSARPQEVPGWDLEIDSDGDEATEIAWVGGELPDEHIQEFGLNMRIDDDAPEVIYFPTIQECDDEELAWIEIPDTVEEWGDFDEPAPYVQRTGGDQAEEDAEEDGQTAGAETAEAEPAAAQTEAGTDPLTYGALAAGVLGLAAGLGAPLRTRRT